MQLESFLQREFQAFEIEIAILRHGITTAVPHVDLLVFIQNEEVQRVVPIVIEQSDIDFVHARNAHGHVLRHEFSAR